LELTTFTVRYNFSMDECNISVYLALNFDIFT